LTGIAICTITEIHFSMTGFTHGLLATIGTGCYQISVATEQSAHKVNGLQALQWMGPHCALMFALLIPVTDDLEALAAYEMTWEAFISIGISCLIAFAINVSVLFIIGRASPLTFQVVGHLKTTLVFVFGFVIMKETIVLKNIFGIFVAFVGMVWYTHLQSNRSPAPSPSETTKESDIHAIHGDTELRKQDKPVDNS